jgi:hypothetical protein
MASFTPALIAAMIAASVFFADRIQIVSGIAKPNRKLSPPPGGWPIPVST